MENPAYVYHELENIYQNHRRYAESQSDAQLRSPEEETDVSLCNHEEAINGKSIVPCGLIAWRLFKDTYDFSRNSQHPATNKIGISWKSDRENKFGRNVFPKKFQNGTLRGDGSLNPNIPLSEQEDLIVWMRTGALPTFRKFYCKIEMDLQAGDTIQVSPQNNYNTCRFNGQKKLVLPTASWLGGKSDFQCIAYLTKWWYLPIIGHRVLHHVSS